MNQVIEKIRDEWEITVCAAALIFLLFAGFRSLFGFGGGLPLNPGGSDMKGALSRINPATAYALLEPAPEPQPPPAAFRPRFAIAAAPATAPQPQPPPRQPKQPKQPKYQPPATPPVVKPKPPEVKTPPPVKPAPPAPAAASITYQGYRTSSDGVRYAVVVDSGSGQTLKITQGRKLHDMMVSKFSEDELVLLTPAGKEIRLKLNQEFIPGAQGQP